MLWKFTSYFVVNFVSCALVQHATGNVLYSILLLTCYILLAKFFYEYISNAKGQWPLDGLFDELQSMEKDKRPLVIERFMQMDRKRNAGRGNAYICESERCVVCLDERAEIQTLPCRHRVICGLCAWGTIKMALQQSAVHTCVVCRRQIRDFNGSLFKNLVNVTWQDMRRILDETKAIQTQPK